MKIFKLIIVVILISAFSALTARSVNSNQQSNKKLDLSKYHNVGNIWLRVSNYGFFGAGRDAEKPSLEYPGGTGIDYLYQGSLWFGAKKYRRNAIGKKLFWLSNPKTATEEPDQTVEPTAWPIVDTLVTVGFDGYRGLYEFLPAYNPLERQVPNYDLYAYQDTILSASIRQQRRGVDDDNDGMIDEDMAGFDFPLREAGENSLPNVFEDFAGSYIADEIVDPAVVEENSKIWFPLGFYNLSYEDPTENYIFTKPTNADNDGLYDEDGAPVSEQDFISYYYDYSPFGNQIERDYGDYKTSNTHVPLNIRVRQMSYQWSYDFIKNLCYIEFNITNMNVYDTLFDCAMGIYVDADCGPQSWDGVEISEEDLSSYNKEGEFAYTYDADGDGGLTTGYIGARVCTPDPEILDFSCWVYNLDSAATPEDYNPQEFKSSGFQNDKYALLTGKNPKPDNIISLRDNPLAQIEDHPEGTDTRFLFAFYGDMQGMAEPGDSSWNLAPKNTMKIVIALFPGQSVNELTDQAVWAKEIYGGAQSIKDVVLPDTLVHYESPEPPAIPNTAIDWNEEGNEFTIYWDNRSELSYDSKTVLIGDIGWQEFYADGDSYVGNYDPETFPAQYSPFNPNGISGAYYNQGAIVNPLTADYLRHDFEGYNLYTRVGSGANEDWQLEEIWDKIETGEEIDRHSQRYLDSLGVNTKDYGGYLGNDKGLPNLHTAEASDTLFYKLNSKFELVKIGIGDTIYGEPIYDPNARYQDFVDIYPETNLELTAEQEQVRALEFKNPNLSEEIYLQLYDSRLIPIHGMGGASAINDEEKAEDLRKDRLFRRYYTKTLDNIERGKEIYISVTAFDRGIPSKQIQFIESGKDGNMKVFFSGPKAKQDMDDIYVVPNPYKGSSFDGRRQNDSNGDRSKRLWFVNLPERCKIRIYTLAGDLVDEIDHHGEYNEDIITLSKAQETGKAASGIHSWDLLSKYNQIIAPGIYLFSVENLENNDIKVGKFVLIK